MASAAKRHLRRVRKSITTGETEEGPTYMKRLLERLSTASNVGIARKDRLRDLKAREPGFFDFEFMKAMPQGHLPALFEYLAKSKSQIRQDLFVLAMLDFKRDGYFVEFGATDGLSLNNTWLLETEFGWAGILAEPARAWHDDLKRNRTSNIDFDCVWSKTGNVVEFTETTSLEHSGITSTLKRSRRSRGQRYDVTTVSLNDLLARHKAPKHIDYFSIDTEGSEYEILASLDYERYSFSVLTVEHNYAAQRDELYALLTAKGYVRVIPDVSRFDDWYVSKELAAILDQT